MLEQTRYGEDRPLGPHPLRRPTEGEVINMAYTLRSGLHIEEVDGAFLIHVRGSNEVVHLTGEQVDAFQHARNSTGPLPEHLTPAMAELVTAGIVETDPLTRRRMLAIGGVGVAASIATFALPSIAAAASPTTTTTPETTTTTTSLPQPSPELEIEYLVVGGGGGGGGTSTGYYAAGGGGAGGVRRGSQMVPANVIGYPVSVGDGGEAGNGAVPATVGGTSSLGLPTAIVANGGGIGGTFGSGPILGNNGGDGASGGGGATGSTPESTGAGGLAIYPSQEGTAGGSAAVSYPFGGGGGGASTSGGAASSGNPGPGGDGIGSQLADATGIGSPVGTVAGGGGGASWGTFTGGAGGQGGGGTGGTLINVADGGVETAVESTAGSPNTGGGGGAQRAHGAANGNGGSGVVIIRYATAEAASLGITVSAGTGDSITTATDIAYTYLAFTASGTLHLDT